MFSWTVVYMYQNIQNDLVTVHMSCWLCVSHIFKCEKYCKCDSLDNVPELKVNITLYINFSTFDQRKQNILMQTYYEFKGMSSIIMLIFDMNIVESLHNANIQ